MNGRLKKLGIVLAVMGFAFVAGSGYALYRTNQGSQALQAFSAAQNVTLAYDDQGVLGGANPEEAAGIMSLLRTTGAMRSIRASSTPMTRSSTRPASTCTRWPRSRITPFTARPRSS